MDEAEARPQTTPREVQLAWLVAAALVAVATIRLFLTYRDCGLLGWDTYPLIDVSRVGSVGDLFAQFGESLMGKSTGGLYYRPLTKLTLALDYGLWGLWAPGYHGTTALLVGATALSLYAAATRLVRAALPAGALAALALFLLHPLLVTVVPVPARRADVLCLLFMALAVAAQAQASQRNRPRPGLVAALAAAAMVSKETAFVLVGLLPVVAFAMSGETDWRARLRAAAVVGAPVIGVVALALLLRVAVLGGAVGERPLQAEGLFGALLDMWARLGSRALAPGAVVDELALPTRTLGMLAASTLGAAFLGTREARRDAAAATIPALVVSLAWIGLVGAIYTVGIIFQAWYVLNAVAGFGLLLAAWVQALLILGRSRPVAGAAAFVGFACVALLLLEFGRYSPLFRPYDDWNEATRVTETYLGTVGRGIEGAAPGEVVRAAFPPPMIPGRSVGPMGIAILAPYSVEAWVRLAYPEHRVRVVPPALGAARAAPEEILVLLGPPPKGGARQGR